MEIKNLEQCQGMVGIVQALSPVVSHKVVIGHNIILKTKIHAYPKQINKQTGRPVAINYINGSEKVKILTNCSRLKQFLLLYVW